MRKKIAGRQKMIEKHEIKIRSELVKAHPDESLISYWQAEIDAVRRQVANLTRRLERDW